MISSKDSFDFLNIVAKFAKDNNYYFPIKLYELKGTAFNFNNDYVIAGLMLGVEYLIDMMNKNNKEDKVE